MKPIEPIGPHPEEVTRSLLRVTVSKDGRSAIRARFVVRIARWRDPGPASPDRKSDPGYTLILRGSRVNASASG